MKTLLEIKHPDLYELVICANEQADKAHAAEVEYREIMRKAMKTLRERLGVSADVFGGMCGVSGQYIFMLENGRRPWNRKIMNKMSQKLELL